VELAQRGERGGVEVAEQVLDGVDDRRGVRLDGHVVTGAQEIEIKRREQRA